MIADRHQLLDEAQLVAPALAADRELTRRALLDHIPADGPRAELYDLVADYPTRASKGVRPALCLAACRAHGGATEDALGAAVAIELLHNAFLVHDDICDGALQRRGLETLHVRHGVPLALNAGNALAWLAFQPLLEDVGSLGASLTLDVFAEFHHLTRRTIEGHATELGWRERGFVDVDADTYLNLVLAKTCWYSTIHPCRVGALIGSRGTADLDAIARFGFFLGAVLQVRDDIENVTDDSEAYGKDYGGDVIEGKPTLLLTHLIEAASAPERAEVVQLVGPNGSNSEVDRDERIERVIGLMERHGSIDYACAFADGLAAAALEEFEGSMGWLPESADKSFLRSVVLYLGDPALR